MADWRTRLALDIRYLRGGCGANEVTITLNAAQADTLARGLDLWATCTRDQTDGTPARVSGRVVDA